MCFLAHIALVFNLTRLNRAARGQDYSVKASKQRGTLGRALVSTYMGVSGLVVLIFVIVHVADMRMARGTYESLYDHIHSVLGVGWKAGLYMVGSPLWAGTSTAELFRPGLGHNSAMLEKAGTALHCPDDWLRLDPAVTLEGRSVMTLDGKCPDGPLANRGSIIRRTT